MTVLQRLMYGEKNKENDKSFFDIKVAGTYIRVHCLYEDTIKLCRDYLVKDISPELNISISNEELHSWAIKEGRGEFLTKEKIGSNVVVNYNYAGLEPLIIYKKIADYLLQKSILLMHGAAIALDNKAYIFTASSGIGKTTHILNWCKLFCDTIVINGDKPLINVDKAIVYGSPWCGKEGLNTNTAVSLAGIISLERGENNYISRISYKEMLPVYLKQTYLPDNQEMAIKAYQLILAMKKIPCYRLTCNMDQESALVAYKGLFEQ